MTAGEVLFKARCTPSGRLLSACNLHSSARAKDLQCNKLSVYDVKYNNKRARLMHTAAGGCRTFNNDRIEFKVLISPLVVCFVDEALEECSVVRVTLCD